ncbi:lysophospholipase, partial [candidate division KSB1 bacterium]
MKKYIIGFCLFLGSFLSLATLSCQRSAPDILDGRIVFLGDSITQDGRYVTVFEYELFKRYPQVDIDVISVGLSSETVSGLTEPDHPYPRPNAHERLGRVLAALKPATVIACYGMNDGIYHPQDDARFRAYKDGVLRLVAAVKATGAQAILLTPPIFDAAAIPERVVEYDAEKFGYATPYRGYNDVLADYARWLESLDDKDVRVIDVNG